MKNTPHTPGPWHYRSNAHSKSTFGISIFHGTAPYEEGLIADLSGRYKSYRTEAEIGPSTIANARLIAAAPDLLSALEEMMSVFQDHEQYDEESAEVIQSARSALRKAKGEA
jgi:hypothetical protein